MLNPTVRLQIKSILILSNVLALCSLHKTVSLVGPRGEMDHVGYIVIYYLCIIMLKPYLRIIL